MQLWKTCNRNWNCICNSNVYVYSDIPISEVYNVFGPGSHCKYLISDIMSFSLKCAYIMMYIKYIHIIYIWCLLYMIFYKTFRVSKGWTLNVCENWCRPTLCFCSETPSRQLCRAEWASPECHTNGQPVAVWHTAGCRWSVLGVGGVVSRQIPGRNIYRVIVSMRGPQWFIMISIKHDSAVRLQMLGSIDIFLPILHLLQGSILKRTPQCSHFERPKSTRQ